MLNELFLLSRRYLESKNQPYQRKHFLDRCFNQRFSTIIGQRGIGKTTLIIQYLLNKVRQNILSKKIIYIPSDHFLLENKSLYEIAESFEQAGGGIIAFDEIHKYPAWSKELKSIYDTFSNLQIIASGSSALEIYKGTHDLTRRTIIHSIYGLSLREYLEMKYKKPFISCGLNEIIQDHEKISTIILGQCKKLKTKILAEFYEYLETGYYPYSFELNHKDAFFITLDQNFHTIIESDINAIYPALNGASIRKLKQLLSFISSNVPFIVNWKKIKSILEVGDERTLKTYFKYLEDAELIKTISFGGSKMSKIEAPEKVYLNNTNQLYAISQEAQNIGTIRETFFLNMLNTHHSVNTSKQGDFLIDNKFIFEIGGKNKSFSQVKKIQNAFLACDSIELGINNKIPLWLFGFLY